MRDVAVDAEGSAWFATGKGVGCIERKPMTLAQKAAYYEDEIDKYHRRTEYGYVLEVSFEVEVCECCHHFVDEAMTIWTKDPHATSQEVTENPLPKQRLVLEYKVYLDWRQLKTCVVNELQEQFPNVTAQDVQFSRDMSGDISASVLVNKE